MTDEWADFEAHEIALYLSVQADGPERENRWLVRFYAGLLGSMAASTLLA